MRLNLRSTAFLLAAAALPLACDSSTGPADRLEVRVLGSSFERDEQGRAEVPYEVVNVGPRPLLLSTCGDWPLPALDRWSGGRWEQHEGSFCIYDAIFAPVELDPGESLQASRSVFSAGRFRLRFGVWENGGEVDWGATSGGFWVE